MNHHNSQSREALDRLAVGLDNAVPPTMPERVVPSPHDPAAVTDIDGKQKTGAQLLAAGLETELRKVQK